MSTRGKFITLEGGEGTGKSTQTKRLVEWLTGRGIHAVATREVGGCPSAEEIRHLWLAGSDGRWDALTEVLLVMAARREHLVRTVWPALEAGSWVVSDRFVDSTRAYQGVCMGVGRKQVDVIYDYIASDFKPDLTLLLDVPVAVGLARMTARRGEDDRYQQQPPQYHEQLRAAFLDIARGEPQRVAVIDASADMDTVSRAITDAVAARCGLGVCE